MKSSSNSDNFSSVSIDAYSQLYPTNPISQETNDIRGAQLDSQPFTLVTYQKVRPRQTTAPVTNQPINQQNYFAALGKVANIANDLDDNPLQDQYADDITVMASNQSTEDLWIDDTSDTAEQETVPTNIRPILQPCTQSMPTRHTAWQALIKQDSLNTLPRADTIFDVARVTRSVQHAISDSGATGHFLVEGAPVINMRIATTPVQIALPNGKVIKSTHTCNLDIPWLPEHMTEAHIVPGLAHSSLISTRKFCDAGCKVTFDMDECKVYYKNELVLVGKRCKTTNLWKLPINPTTKPTSTTISSLDLQATKGAINTTISGLGRQFQQATRGTQQANTVYTIPHKQNQVKYMHQCFFSPPMQTLLDAIANDQLKGIPFMKQDIIRKYLAPSPATSKGRMKRPRAGIRSTRKTYIDQNKTWRQRGKENNNPAIHPNAARTAPTYIPSDEPQVNNVFCFAALADKQRGTMYTDATGALPAMSIDGHQYYFVAYDYDTNYIFAIPIKDVTDDSIMAAFHSVFNELKEKGHKPTFNVTDNQATRPIKEYLKKENCKWQFVEPSNHRANAAERAIQTYKNHFISGLCSTDAEWPIQLWHQLTTQAVITINILRTSRIDPTKSAYHQLHGHRYDWTAHPLAPPGTRAVIYDSPESRRSWSPRGTDAWYCGPSLDHYRNDLFYCPVTNSYRTSGSFDLFPQHCLLPEFTPNQHSNEVYDELMESIGSMKRPAQAKLLKKMAKALRDIATNTQAPIQRVVPSIPSEGEQPAQRVSTAPMVTTSTNPTAPRTLQAKPRTHLRKTRGNTPGSLPAIINPDAKTTRRSPRFNDIENVTIKPLATEPNSSRIPMARSHIISQEAINMITEQVYYKDPVEMWSPQSFLDTKTTEVNNIFDVDIDHFCNGVVHPVTGETITKYKTLVRDPITNEIWSTAFGKEIGNMAQGDLKTGEKGTNSIFAMTHDEIANIPKDRVVTYASVVVDFRPQKKDPNRVRITAGGNLIKYPGELTTRTADLTTSKVLWNSILSTKDAKFMGIDIKSFYLETPLDRFEYMRMPLSLFPQHTIDQYDLARKAKNGYVFWEIRKAIYGLPQAGALANKLLRKRLAPAGYMECAHTPGLWRHVTRPVQFTLVVDDFGVKYVGKEHADHLIRALKQDYTIEEDWEGKLYCGITLDWDYENRTLTISMPGYIKKLLIRFKHELKGKQYTPYKAAPKTYGTDAQRPLPQDTARRLEDDEIKPIQQVVGGVLYYARAVDLTVLAALSSIASEQSEATENTQKKVEQLLDYLATLPDAQLRFHASDMILNIHSDASYLSESRARSRVAGMFFLGSTLKKGQPIQLNGSIFVFSGILKFVVASAAEAELAALFLNAKDGKIIRLILQELGHNQPPTPIHCDNVTAAGIANNTVKKQRSRSMEMRFFWITDQVKLGNFDVQWHPGQENLADYFTKHFDAKHHQEVRAWYLHMYNSPRFLPRAAAPSTLKGCVGTLPNGYIRSAPLPRIQSVPVRQAYRVPSTRVTSPHALHSPTLVAPIRV